MRVERSIDLPCDAPAAWAILTGWEAQADWMRDADRVEVLSPHREGLGVRLAVKTRLFGIPAFTEPIEVTAWEPPSRLEIRHGGPLRGRGVWRLREAGVGAARFTWVEDVRLAIPVLGALAAAPYAPLLWILMGRGQRDLRDRIAGG
jgi:polyketide cyclase/dehydrase/lipid transport protein